MAELEILGRTRGGWRPTQREFARWRDAALGRRARHSAVCLLLVGTARSRTLNRGFRGRDYPTNVLSFPAVSVPMRIGSAAAGRRPAASRRRRAAPSAPVRGDLVICPAVLRAEARRQRKSMRAHWAHLFIHGLLHLAGYDHERRSDAERMERREIRILARFGIANPYLEPLLGKA